MTSSGRVGWLAEAADGHLSMDGSGGLANARVRIAIWRVWDGMDVVRQTVAHLARRVDVAALFALSTPGPVVRGGLAAWQPAVS